MSPTHVTLKVPGEPVEKNVPNTGAGASAVETQETIARKDQTLREQLAITERLVGSPAALNWDHLNGAMAVQAGYKPTGPDLPDQLDVDPNTLKEPVLTKQGWVLPVNDPRARFGGH